MFPTARRKFRIRSYGERNLFNTVDFAKESYSPGDSVLAKLKVRKADGTLVPEGTMYSYTATVLILLLTYYLV